VGPGEEDMAVHELRHPRLCRELSRSRAIPGPVVRGRGARVPGQGLSLARPAAPRATVDAMNDLLTLAIAGHGGMRRWERISRFRVVASITGAIWARKGWPDLPGNVVLEGETRDHDR
jgi:hypothetical protein